MKLKDISKHELVHQALGVNKEIELAKRLPIPSDFDPTGYLKNVAGQDHSTLANLSYATAGHTGFLQDANDVIKDTHIDWGTGAGQVSTTDMTEGTNLYFTDERAQDAIGAMIGNSLQYVDATPLLDTIQDIRTTASPQFANLILGVGGTIKPSAANNEISIVENDDTPMMVFQTVTHRAGFGPINPATGSPYTYFDTATGKAWFTDLEMTNAIVGSITGNAATATQLATARTIGGNSFNGSANIKIGALNSTNVDATTSAELAGVISDETGSGKLVFDTSPTFTTPTLGAAQATSVDYGTGAAIFGSSDEIQMAYTFHTSAPILNVYPVGAAFIKTRFGFRCPEAVGNYARFQGATGTTEGLTSANTIGTITFMITAAAADPLKGKIVFNVNKGDASTDVGEFNDAGNLSLYTNKLLFGTAGSEDTNLYRSAANTLKTDDTFDAGAGVIFPSADPHIAGVWWDSAGTLTKSAG